MTIKWKIAIVDDDVILSRLIQKAIQVIQNVEIVLFKSGEHFLNANEKFHLVIVDYHLMSYNNNNLNGEELIIKINEKFLNEISIIVLTGQQNILVAKKVIKLGVIDYIEKTDFYEIKLVNSIRDFIRLYEINEQILEMLKWLKIRAKKTIGMFILIFVLISLLMIFLFIV